MPTNKDLYEILGVAREADREAIQKAYRRIARENHPDLNPDDPVAEERFKDASAAWEVLGDDERRRTYDEFGAASLEPGFDPQMARDARERFGGGSGPGAHWGGGGISDDLPFGDIDDLLRGVFGGGGGSAGIRLRGGDLETALEIEFREAVRGAEKRITFARPSPDGGRVTETINVRIPPGVETGRRLRLRGKGGPGVGGGPAGDLYATLRVLPDRVFRRIGADLELDLPVTVREAILGTRVEVPTLDGRAAVAVPPGTQGGTRLRLRGKGVPGAAGRAAGDLYARVQVRVPVEIDEDARGALDVLGRHDDPEIRNSLAT